MEEPQVASTIVRSTDHRLSPRRPYDPPHAEFVPLRVEERLMKCAKDVRGTNVTCSFVPTMS